MKTKRIRLGLRLLVLGALILGVTGMVEAQQRGGRRGQTAPPPRQQAQAEEESSGIEGNMDDFFSAAEDAASKTKGAGMPTEEE